jgi:hypothetical protein
MDLGLHCRVDMFFVVEGVLESGESLLCHGTCVAVVGERG